MAALVKGGGASVRRSQNLAVARMREHYAGALKVSPCVIPGSEAGDLISDLAGSSDLWVRGRVRRHLDIEYMKGFDTLMEATKERLSHGFKPLSEGELQCCDGGGILLDALVVTGGTVLMAAGALLTVVGVATLAPPAIVGGVAACTSGFTMVSNLKSAFV